MNELTSVIQRKARKVHYCSDCGRPILPGCEYLAVRGMQDGSFFYEKEHIHCDAAIRAYEARTSREVYYGRLDEVVEWLYETACPGCPHTGTCRNSGQDIFECTAALRRVLPPTVLSAALESVRKNIDIGGE